MSENGYAYNEGFYSGLIQYLEFVNPCWTPGQIAEELRRFDSRLDVCEQNKEEVEHWIAHYLFPDPKDAHS